MQPGSNEGPPGVAHLGGALINDRDASTADEYVMEHVREGERDMLWFQRLLGPAENPSAEAQVLDAVDLPAIEEGYELVLTMCELNGELDTELAALVRFGREAFSSDIQASWRFSRATEKIEVISTEGLACENIGHGT